jgi:hypothetical protein
MGANGLRCGSGFAEGAARVALHHPLVLLVGAGAQTIDPFGFRGRRSIGLGLANACYLSAVWRGPGGYNQIRLGLSTRSSTSLPSQSPYRR